MAHNRPIESATALARLAWPFAFVPLTVYAVMEFGHAGGNLLLGALFLALVVKADAPVRRLMIVLAVLAAIFETANVASGAYRYHGVLGAPMWIPLGWGILGWWVARIEKELARIGFKEAFAACALIITVPAVLAAGFSLSIPIAIAGLYVLSLASKKPFAIFAFTSFFAVVAEYSGTAAGLWTYYSPAGAAMSPDLAGLAMAYSTVMAFSFWVSGFEKE